eukprot:TRINITY_DN3622_c0_g1_i2.p1 TRINITY_DN3622_c0_g1~~TRINITY_DN3622_c0_g1_i2.p1  ORF type:complete len:612 (-),score=97.49 TRINITY_DN3622_c0_g1_i2:39-1601(-)
MTSLQGRHIVQVACGEAHTLALTADGRVYAWGSNGRGQLGTGDLSPMASPTLVQTLGNLIIVQVSCGAVFSAALTERGDVWTWGANDAGQLGWEDRTDVLLPSPVEKTLGGDVRFISCGRQHITAIIADGSVLAWGGNECGQLGVPVEGDTSNPQVVKALLDIPIRQVACGATETVAMTAGRGSMYSTDPLPLEQRRLITSPTFQSTLKLVERLKSRLVSELKDVEKQLQQAMFLSQEALKSAQKRRETLHTQVKRAMGTSDRSKNQSPESELLTEQLYAAQSLENGLMTTLHETEDKVARANQVVLKEMERKPGERISEGFDQESILMNEVGEITRLSDSVLEARKACGMVGNVHRTLQTDEHFQDVSLRARLITGLFYVTSLGERLRDTSIEKLNPVYRESTSAQSLLKISNALIDQILAEAERLTKQDSADVQVELAQLLIDNARMRKRLNDYTEGILERTFEKLETYSREHARPDSKLLHSSRTFSKVEIRGIVNNMTGAGVDGRQVLPLPPECEQ